MNIGNDIKFWAGAMKIPAMIVYAICWVESGFYPYAFNPEPRYRWFWDVKKNKPFRRLRQGEMENKIPPQDFPCLYGDRDQEWWLQQASIGIMQTMGAVARESGFNGKSLLELINPSISLEFGCKFIAKLRDRHLNTSGWEGVVSAYNTGSPNVEGAGLVYKNKIWSKLGPDGLKLDEQNYNNQ